ncbi:hypothetical protein GCM10027449_30110 [Sinomonas notoginsengisoli]|uniref:endolytic transglycosylase MltG n=1 Tax=Sinomonas notoginsengisoli TaxID=1457311 RepID=UPI001F367CC7|nr:endolytic transglycosylase MltG [Sinomonas notoginsengisoli]
MDPQENTTTAVPDRPLTRRELRERERAQQEAQQRMLAPQRRAYPAPGSASPRPGTASGTSKADQRSSGADRTDAQAWASVPSQVRPPQASSEPKPAPSNLHTDGVDGPRTAPSDPGTPHTGSHGVHGRRRARTFEAAETGPHAPTSAAMGWGSYPPSSGSTFAPPPAVTAGDPGAPAVLPAPVPAARSPFDGIPPVAGDLEARAVAAPSSAPNETPGRPAEPAATAYFPAVAQAPLATRPVARVAAPQDAPIRRNVFPAAAQAFARSSALTAEPVHELEHDWDRHPVQAEAFPTDDGVHPLDAAYHEALPGDHGALLHGHGTDAHAFETAHGVFGEPVAAKVPSRRARRFRVLIGLTVALALFVGAALIGVEFLKPILGIDHVKDYSGPGSGSVVVTVQAGSGAAAVASTLEKQDVVADAGTFLKAFAGAGGSLHPGDYTFKKQMKSSDAAAILAGTGNEKVIYFALSAGMRVGESLDAIAKAAAADRKDLDALNSKPGDFGLPAKAKNLEGYLAPGEYRFPVGTAAKDILGHLVSVTLDKLKADGVTDPSKQYDVLTVASIVQAEGGRADYGNVAGAIYNRLKSNAETNGYIQSDATVTYGLGKKSYHITDQEKADKGNPYNTYANSGLPAGPIGSPGATAIDAASKPTSNDYLYWVTVNLDTGETKFSKTYAEHQGYAQQYEQWCQANAGKCR